MREYNLSTARGKQLYDMGNTCCWGSLHNLYENGHPQKNTPLTGVGNNIVKVKIAQLLA